MRWWRRWAISATSSLSALLVSIWPTSSKKHTCVWLHWIWFAANGAAIPRACIKMLLITNTTSTIHIPAAVQWMWRLSISKRTPTAFLWTMFCLQVSLARLTLDKHNWLLRTNNQWYSDCTTCHKKMLVRYIRMWCTTCVNINACKCSCTQNACHTLILSRTKISPVSFVWVLTSRTTITNMKFRWIWLQKEPITTRMRTTD